MQRFFKGAPIIWIVVLTEKAGLFFWYALLKSLYASWAGVPFSAVAGVAALFCGWGAENLAIPTRYPFGPPHCSPLTLTYHTHAASSRPPRAVSTPPYPPSLMH